MNAPRLRTVALLACDPGLHVLTEVLLRRRELQIAAVFTHLRRSEADARTPARELNAMREACRAAGAPLVFADGEEARDLLALLPNGDLDLLIRLSWRYGVDASTLGRFRLGGIDLRTGPSGEGPGRIGAYEMSGQGGCGRAYAEAWADGDGDAALAPLYATLARRAIDAMLAGEGAMP